MSDDRQFVPPPDYEFIPLAKRGLGTYADRTAKKLIALHQYLANEPESSRRTGYHDALVTAERLLGDLAPQGVDFSVRVGELPVELVDQHKKGLGYRDDRSIGRGRRRREGRPGHLGGPRRFSPEHLLQLLSVCHRATISHFRRGVK